MDTSDRETVFLPSLAREREIIRKETFLNTDFKGPAVIALMGHIDIDQCAFREPIEDVLWEFDWMRPYQYIGAIGIEDCKFVGCTFERIGVLANPDSQDAIRLAVAALE